MSSLINRAIEAIDEAATETVIFNAEKQVEILQKARKRKRITKSKFSIPTEEKYN